ncbi:MAG: hypothetical protein R2879_04540 [Saprospiraceae bacterium]
MKVIEGKRTIGKIYMKTINFGHIKLEIDIESTEKFYESQKGFVCDCPNCIHFVNNIPNLQKALEGLDKEMGIDLTKAVGQGMDELMPHDYNDNHLDMIPYYAVGNCYVRDKELVNSKSRTTLTNPNPAYI